MKSLRNALRTGNGTNARKSSKSRMDGGISHSSTDVTPLGMPAVKGQSSVLYECPTRSKMDASSAAAGSGRGSSGSGDAGSSSRRSPGRDGLHGSLEVTYGLPVLDKPHIQSAAFRSITGQTLASEIKRLGWSAFDAKYILVDCRYPYEYAGGHIKCAMNVHDKSQLKPHFFPVHGRIPIFHCEFSHKRGPAMAHALRDFDRRVNLDRYVRGDPSDLCEPNAYVEMFSDKAQLARYKNHLKRSEQVAPKSRLRAVGRKIRGFAVRPLRFSASPPSPVAAKRMKHTTPPGPQKKTGARKSHECTPRGTKGFMRPLTQWYPVTKKARVSMVAWHKTPISDRKPDASEGHITTPVGASKRRTSKPIVEYPVSSDDVEPHEASNPLPAMGRLSFEQPTSSVPKMRT